jgi:hypothetical protein
MHVSPLLLLGMFLLSCSTARDDHRAASRCDYHSLREVEKEPERATGATLCAEVFSYSSHGFFAFYDRPVHTTREAVSNVALMVDDGDAKRNFPGTYPKDGERVRASGQIDLQLSCYLVENSCAPIPHPIYLKSAQLKIINE